MSPSAGVLAPQAESGGRTALWLTLGVVVALLAGLYVAGYCFLWSIGERPQEASPLTWIRYAWWYGGMPVARSRLALSGIAGAAPLLIGSVLAFRRPREPIHGAARFARRREIRRAGLFGEHGIILGKLGRRYLLLDGQQGVALAAPPRAGKGVGVVIPNALNWPGSLVCVDIKRENWDLTAGFRSQSGQKCYLFDPLATDGQTARWNPLWYVPEDASLRVSGLQQIAEMLYPDPAAGDPFWTASARSLFLGIALYLFETPGKLRTMGEVLRQGMASDEEGFEEHWKRVVEGRQRGSLPLSRVCVQALYDVIRLSPITCSSIRKTFTSRLDLWLNPILDRATSDNDFNLRQLREEPISIYVAVRPDDLHRLRPVLNLFFQQAIGLQTHELPEQNPKLTVKVMMLLDEFTALGRIPILSESISYLPGYNVRVLLVIQSLSQLREVYGINNAETMLKSLAARIVFAPKDITDAKEISEELGYVTVKGRSRTRATFWSGAQGRSPSVNESDQRRALRLPQELRALGRHEAIVFYEGLNPILCRKIRYYREPAFRRRLLPPPAERPVSLDVVLNELEGDSDAAELPAGGHEGRQVVAELERTQEELTSMDLAALTLDDFEVPAAAVAAVSGVGVPVGTEPISDNDISAQAEAFLASLMEDQ